jgi:hypothetical protein
VGGGKENLEIIFTFLASNIQKLAKLLREYAKKDFLKNVFPNKKKLKK